LLRLLGNLRKTSLEKRGLTRTNFALIFSFKTNKIPMIYCLIGWSNPLSFVGSSIIAHIFKFVNTTIFNFPQKLKQQEKPTLKSIRGRGKNRKVGGGFPAFLMGNDFRN
jgi:hypothetical protein